MVRTCHRHFHPGYACQCAMPIFSFTMLFCLMVHWVQMLSLKNMHLNNLGLYAPAAVLMYSIYTLEVSWVMVHRRGALPAVRLWCLMMNVPHWLQAFKIWLQGKDNAPLSWIPIARFVRVITPFNKQMRTMKRSRSSKLVNSLTSLTAKRNMMGKEAKLK